MYISLQDLFDHVAYVHGPQLRSVSEHVFNLFTSFIAESLLHWLYTVVKMVSLRLKLLLTLHHCKVLSILVCL